MTTNLRDSGVKPAAAAAVPPTTLATRLRSMDVVTGAGNLAPEFDLLADPVTGRLILFGELDLAGTQRLRNGITIILARGPAVKVVDLANLRFIDAGGIGLLVGLRNELTAADATLRLCNPVEQVSRVFALCGLSVMLTATVA